MSRHYFALDLRNDPQVIAEYERWHQAAHIWPDIVASIHAGGIHRMEIFRTGHRLVMVIEADDDNAIANKASADAGNQRVQAWEQLMSTYQQSLPWAAPGQKWVPMTRIFNLAECHIESMV